MEHEVTSTKRCAKCGFKSETTEPGYILTLALPPPNKQTLTLTEIIKYNFSAVQKRMEDSLCRICKSNNMTLVTDVTSTGSCLIVQLILHSIRDGEIAKITNYSVKGVPTDRPSFCSKQFKVNSAIFHQGKDTAKGHYTCMLRDKTSGWQHVSDSTVDKRRWNAKDAYIFFLQHI